ncbi:MAG: purine-nucleoside phosphorylase [Candidatus Sericytochromatia bacterium]
MRDLLSKDTIEYVNNFFPDKPKIAVILGSGVKALEDLENEKKLSYNDIPNFPKSTVAGHAGVISIGKYDKKNIAVLRGRFHKYEGHNWKSVISPVALMKEMGVEVMILTNAAGGINRIYIPGELMLIEDHLNFQVVDEEEKSYLNEYLKDKRKVDFYDKELTFIARESCKEAKVRLHEGIYLSLSGPSYETRAEILMMRKMNVDAVGMSTVPEVIWSNALDMKVMGISCITNSTYYEKAMSETSHEEVVDVAKKASENIDKLLKQIITRI